MQRLKGFPYFVCGMELAIADLLGFGVGETRDLDTFAAKVCGGGLFEKKRAGKVSISRRD